MASPSKQASAGAPGRRPAVRRVCLAFALVWPAMLGGAPAAPVDFNFQIRPLLADRCFPCHGPDAKSRKAKLRLDVREGALGTDKAGKPIIKPGDSAASEVVRRIFASDPDDHMPPPESKLSLTPAEQELIRKWIAQGAEFKQHWAFLPVEPVAVPEVKDRGWVRNEIDAFVLSRLEREDLKPSPEASHETLIRRLSFDLTGLPPTVAEIDAFLADTSPEAYEKVVDRLLASPRYGEWMAVEWMDLARFADTFGYQADVDCDLSPWRDWVIRAFNENLPYDQFLTWQLAGDLMPNATRDQILATAFNRLHRQTNEGGSIEEEFRTEYVVDRVNTFGTAMLGLTVQCARCHDHKFDPISQRDYYSLAAFFNSIDESGLYSHFTRAMPTPVMLLWPGDAEQRHAALLDRIAAAEAKLKQIAVEARPRFAAWSQTHTAALPGLPRPVVKLAFETIDGAKTPSAVSTNAVELIDGPVLVEGRVGKAMKFSGDNSAVVKDAGVFRRTDPFSFDLWLKPTEQQARAVVFHCSRAWTDSGSRGYELVLDEGRPFFALIHFWPGNALAVRAKEALPLGAWSHLAVTYDGSSRAAGVRLYLNGSPLATEVVRDNLYKDILHKAEWGDAEVGNIHLTLAGRFRDSGFKDGVIDEFQAFDTELTASEVAVLAAANEPPASTPQPYPFDWNSRSPSPQPSPVGRGRDFPSGGEPSPSSDSSPRGDRSFPLLGERVRVRASQNFDGISTPQASWFDYYLARHDAGYRAAEAELKRLRVAEDDLITPVREIMVMKELPQPRPTFVLRRGAYDAPGERVQRDVPERVFPFPAAYPRGRLGLARWVTNPRNPLTARVAVNRMWNLHFGRGLVATTWDFGSQGDLPTHPQLLDWLAKHFVDSGWDAKALHKLIVMSATYRQSSQAGQELLARDPENRLLARGPKHRLAAEQIRDAALAASGLLNAAIGGPSVKPYQPPGVWEESGTGKTYVQDHGDKLYRRSLYTFWRRTAPPPAMLTFDATTREVCTAKREITTTPLQALVLLNDTQFVEAARVLAVRLALRHPHDLVARGVDAFRSLIGRPPDARERDILHRLLAEQKAVFARDPTAAARLLATGEAPRDASLPAADLAATTVLVSTVMNADEFVMER